MIALRAVYGCGRAYEPRGAVVPLCCYPKRTDTDVILAEAPVERLVLALSDARAVRSAGNPCEERVWPAILLAEIVDALATGRVTVASLTLCMHASPEALDAALKAVR